MVKAWIVSVKVARDDNAPLSEQGMNQLADSLTKRGAEPVLRHSEGGAVLVSMTVDGRNELEARSTAQNVLREAAGAVWSALGLPPFTITLVEAKPKR